MYSSSSFVAYVSLVVPAQKYRFKLLPLLRRDIFFAPLARHLLRRGRLKQGPKRDSKRWLGFGYVQTIETTNVHFTDVSKLWSSAQFVGVGSEHTFFFHRAYGWLISRHTKYLDTKLTPCSTEEDGIVCHTVSKPK